jgi:hypothetical protein
MVGVCPACPDGGVGGGEKERGDVAPQPWSPALGHRVLYVHALFS